MACSFSSPGKPQAADPEFDGTLPHHVAICVTKFDEPKVFDTAERLKLLRYDRNDPFQFPRVEGGDARLLFASLCSSSSGNGNGDLMLNALEQYFREDRVKFFVTSAVGFYVDPYTNKFDRDNPQNVVKNKSGLAVAGDVADQGSPPPDQHRGTGALAWRADRAGSGTPVTSTNPLISVEAQWALYGKRLDRQGYRVLACSTGELSMANFEEVIGRFSPGTPSKLPQVTMSYLTPATQPGESLLAMAIHQTGDGEQQLKYDDDGRRVVVTSYFCVPYQPLKPAAVSYQALYQAALAELPLPPEGGPPITIKIAGRAGVTPAVDDLAMRAAALLLTCRPVCVLGAEDTTADERLAFIDTVMSLLPYGLRAMMTAATWTRPTNRDHRFRLFFSDAARAADADRVLYWGRPEATAFSTAGDDYYAYEYLNWLEEKVGQPTTELAQLTDPIGFGRDSIRRTLETIGVKSENSAMSYPGGGQGLPHTDPIPQLKTGTGRGFGEQVLRDCAAHVRADGQQHLVSADIGKLAQIARSPIHDDQQARYREIIKETGLLQHAERLGDDADALYEQLLRVGFGVPFGYDDYCQLEDCLERQPAQLALLTAIHNVGMTEHLVKAIVYGQLQRIDMENPQWHISRKSEQHDVVTLIRHLATDWRNRPDHARIVCDFTLGCLSNMNPNPDPIREALRRASFLAKALRSNGVGTEQYQVNVLFRFLEAAYPNGLDRPSIMQILTGNRLPPTPPLVAAVLLLAEPADVELAAGMYARGSIISGDFAAELRDPLKGKVPMRHF